MKLKITHPFWQVISLGVLAGMQTGSAPEIANHIISRRRLKNFTGDGNVLNQHKKVGLTMKGLAVAEAATQRPSKRTGVRSFSLISRCIAGSLVGASIYKATGGSVIAGSVLGGITALGATLGSFYLQKDADSKKYVMNPVITALEDALVIGAGKNVISVA